MARDRLPHPWRDEPKPVSSIKPCQVYPCDFQCNLSKVALLGYPYRRIPLHGNRKSLVTYWQFRGQGGPPEDVGFSGDIYVDVHPPYALYFRHVDSWKHFDLVQYKTRTGCNRSGELRIGRNYMASFSHPHLKARILFLDIDGPVWCCKDAVARDHTLRKVMYEEPDFVTNIIKRWLANEADSRGFTLRRGQRSDKRPNTHAWWTWGPEDTEPSGQHHTRRSKMSEPNLEANCQYRLKRSRRQCYDTDTLASDADRVNINSTRFVKRLRFVENSETITHHPEGRHAVDSNHVSYSEDSGIGRSISLTETILNGLPHNLRDSITAHLENLNGLLLEVGSSANTAEALAAANKERKTAEETSLIDRRKLAECAGALKASLGLCDAAEAQRNQAAQDNTSFIEDLESLLKRAKDLQLKRGLDFNIG